MRIDVPSERDREIEIASMYKHGVKRKFVQEYNSKKCQDFKGREGKMNQHKILRRKSYLSK